MNKRQNEAQMQEVEFLTISDAEEAVRKAKVEWEQLVAKGAEIQEKELLDYHPVELSEEDQQKIKKKKKIISGIKRILK